MIDLIEQHKNEIIALCKEYGVSRLEVFGSAVTGKFDPERSDIDFLVEFGEKFDYNQFFELKEALELLLGREVELVTRRYLRNPYFIKAVEASKIPLYAA